jgi:hypothetical protein
MAGTRGARARGRAAHVSREAPAAPAERRGEGYAGARPRADAARPRAHARRRPHGRRSSRSTRTLDKDLFDQLEQIVLLSKAIRTADTFAAHSPSTTSYAERDDGSLQDIQEQLAAFKAAQDPREPVSTEEDVWRTIAAVAKESSIDPLAERAGREQPSIVVRMALEACRSPTGQRWLQSFGISIPASSPSTSTSGS